MATDQVELQLACLVGRDADKAERVLGWKPLWTFEQSVAATVDWYRKCAANADAMQLTQQQIDIYSGQAREASIAWAANSE